MLCQLEQRPFLQHRKTAKAKSTEFFFNLRTVAYAGFSKGGGARKFEINEDQNENFPAQNQVRFSAQN